MATSGPFQRNTPRFVALVALVVAVILWGLAVALPVWEVRSKQTGQLDMVRGALPALIGWLGLLALCPAWFANLLLIPLGITIYKARRAGFWFSVLAFGIAASAYMMPAIYGDNDEAVIVARRIGFYLWLGSFFIMALGHALVEKGSKSSLGFTRWGTLACLVLAIVGLERIFPVAR